MRVWQVVEEMQLTETLLIRKKHLADALMFRPERHVGDGPSSMSYYLWFSRRPCQARYSLSGPSVDLPPLPMAPARAAICCDVAMKPGGLPNEVVGMDHVVVVPPGLPTMPMGL